MYDVTPFSPSVRFNDDQSGQPSDLAAFRRDREALCGEMVRASLSNPTADRLNARPLWLYGQARPVYELAPGVQVQLEHPTQDLPALAAAWRARAALQRILALASRQNTLREIGAIGAPATALAEIEQLALAALPD